MESRKVVIAGYARSPFTPATKGELADVRTDDMTAQVIKGLLSKTGLNPALVEDFKMGCAFPEAEQGFNVARNVVLLAGLPQEIAGVTTNRFCGSSMQAIQDAAGAIAMGMMDCVIAGGGESMSRIPMTGFNPMPNVELAKREPGAYMAMPETAENVAERFGISRQEQDAFSLKSQFKAAAAKNAGLFADDIVPIVKADGNVVSEDGCLRPESTLEGLAKLKPIVKPEGTVTAGNACPTTDGATAVLVCSEDFAVKHGLKIMAEIASFAVSGCDPLLMGMGPVPASRKAFAKAGITEDDVARVVMNEAFASQSIACARELGLDEEKLNVRGGAIARGHALGATSAMLVGDAAKDLAASDKADGDYALATQCIGGGQGTAIVLKRYTAAPKL